MTHLVAFGGSRPIMAAPVFAAWLGVPLITLIRGNDFDAAVFSTRRRPVLDQAFARSQLVCAVSRDKVDKIAALHPGVPVRWIPNGIDRSNWELAPSDRARAQTWRAETVGEGRRVLGLFGQLKAKKGGVFLLDALLRSGVADAFHLLLAGWMEPELEAWLSEHELPFTALPFLDRFELLPWYAACDWIAIPSFYDGLPNVLVEAAALGVPMLAARAGGMVDVLEDGRTAFLFDPGDEARCAWAIQRAARLEEAARVEMGAACRALAASTSSTASWRSRATSTRSPRPARRRCGRSRDPLLRPRRRARPPDAGAQGPGGAGHRGDAAHRLTLRRRPARDRRSCPCSACHGTWGETATASATGSTGTLAVLRPDELIVDSFPGGILGELCGMTLPPARHVARRLRWTAYAQRFTGRLPRYDVIYELEPMSHEHARALTGPIERLTLPVASPGAPLVDEPHWLVVHSGPDHELDRLLAHAADAPRIVVVSPRRPARLPERAQWRDVYPVAPHLPHAERIVTAAGFNLMQETAHLRDRHTFVPFERALDDQFARSGPSGAERAAGLAVGDGTRDRGGVVLGDAAIAHRLIVLAPLVDAVAGTA